MLQPLYKSHHITYKSLDAVVHVPDKSNPWANRKRQVTERDNLFYSVIQEKDWIIEDVGRPCFEEGLKDRISSYHEKVIILRNNNYINTFINGLID
jgi:hypothetical protein